MKKLVVASFLLFLLLLTVGAKPVPPVPPAYQVDVAVVPVQESPIQLLPHQWRNAFKCTATVTDFATGEPRAHVEAIVQPGRRGVEKREMNGLTVMLAAEVNREEESAVTEVVITRGGTPLLRQRSITRFLPADRVFRRR